MAEDQVLERETRRDRMAATNVHSTRGRNWSIRQNINPPLRGRPVELDRLMPPFGPTSEKGLRSSGVGTFSWPKPGTLRWPLTSTDRQDAEARSDSKVAKPDQLTSHRLHSDA